MGRTDLCRTAWDSMDACTRCGEAIPVVWARNTGDPGEHPHFTHPIPLRHIHTHTHTPLTKHDRDKTRTQGPKDPRRAAHTAQRLGRPRRQTLLHLGPWNYCANNPDRHHPSITTTTLLHRPPPTSSRTSNTVSLPRDGAYMMTRYYWKHLRIRFT